MMRKALLESYLAAGVAIAFWTELLSCFSALRFEFVWPCWILIGLFAVVRLRGAVRHLRPRKVLWREIAFASALLTMVATVGATAVLSAPNSADAMAYHLPRVIYWLQQDSVRFFPTVYFNQITMPPLAEYAVMHTFLISGGDHLVNLVQFSGYVAAIVASSLVARELGGGGTAQWLAALLTATLPGAILQASGAKNDCVLAGLLMAGVFFGLRRSYVWFGAAAALAIFTKSTAYLFLPPLFAAVVWLRADVVRFAGWTVALVLAVNGPQFARNLDLSGSPLGFDSAQGDGVYRWRNEAVDLRAMLSNVLRHVSEQLGARSERWNQTVFDVVIAIHRKAGIDPNDPKTTWPGDVYQPPRNANHEANAHSRWHLLLYLLCGLYLAAVGWRKASDRPQAVLYAAIGVAFLCFCAYLKWQPFMQRLLLPLLLMAAPAAAVLLSRLPAPVIVGVSLLLVNNSRPYLVENWTRPLKGAHSLLKTSRSDQYFNDMSQWNRKEAYLATVDFVKQTGCKEIGLDISQLQLEYPLQALLRQHDAGYRFQHAGVGNVSAKYGEAGTRPCAVVCLACEGIAGKDVMYSEYGERRLFADFVVFSGRRGN